MGNLLLVMLMVFAQSSTFDMQGDAKKQKPCINVSDSSGLELLDTVIGQGYNS